MYESFACYEQTSSTDEDASPNLRLRQQSRTDNEVIDQPSVLRHPALSASRTPAPQGPALPPTPLPRQASGGATPQPGVAWATNVGLLLQMIPSQQQAIQLQQEQP
ncbi:hypothetical protein PI124_g10615 [Phytophthora idaei]|nr:hypothetical protein PI125_g11698 [Phytophthora idaei]KAG3151610.1 hypothetical protein PI126_g10907 [Phytophthora idaei]KAG3244630.1 hypothetical protein PI124_g10615 [Phytophthora idaei]